MPLARRERKGESIYATFRFRNSCTLPDAVPRGTISGVSDELLKEAIGLGLLVWIVVGLSGVAPVVSGLGFVVALVAGIALMIRHLSKEA